MDEYYYELLLDPLALTAGETYYLGIANEDNLAWGWEYSSVFTGNARQVSAVCSWKIG